MTTSMPLEIFIMRVSAACLFCADDRDEHGRADQGSRAFPRFCRGNWRWRRGIPCASAASAGIAGGDGVLAQCLQLVLAAVERDLAGGDLDFQAMQRLADGERPAGRAVRW